jgi:hypothetical protein
MITATSARGEPGAVYTASSVAFGRCGIIAGGVGGSAGKTYLGHIASG